MSRIASCYSSESRGANALFFGLRVAAYVGTHQLLTGVFAKVSNKYLSRYVAAISTLTLASLSERIGIGKKHSLELATARTGWIEKGTYAAAVAAARKEVPADYVHQDRVAEARAEVPDGYVAEAEVRRREDAAKAGLFTDAQVRQLIGRARAQAAGAMSPGDHAKAAIKGWFGTNDQGD